LGFDGVNGKGKNSDRKGHHTRRWQERE